jgi:hypothetical protein
MPPRTRMGSKRSRSPPRRPGAMGSLEARSGTSRRAAPRRNPPRRRHLRPGAVHGRRGFVFAPAKNVYSRPPSPRVLTARHPLRTRGAAQECTPGREPPGNFLRSSLAKEQPHGGASRGPGPRGRTSRSPQLYHTVSSRSIRNRGSTSGAQSLRPGPHARDLPVQAPALPSSPLVSWPPPWLRSFFRHAAVALNPPKSKKVDGL